MFILTLICTCTTSVTNLDTLILNVQNHFFAKFEDEIFILENF